MRIAPISVIIPCYLCSQVLPRAVDSVLRQSLLPAEIILVDDASPDQGETRRCIEEMVSSHSTFGEVRIRASYMKHNEGPGGARNAAWNIATETYVAFLDADDSWVPEKLEIQYDWMLEHPDFTLSCHESLHITDAEKSPSYESIRYDEIHGFSLMLKNSIPARSVMLVNRPDFRFPPTMRYAEDYWLWLNMAMRGARMAKIRAPLAFSYKREYGEGGLSGNLSAMHAGVLNCYEDLRRQRVIGPLTFWVVSILEKMKHIKRVILTGVYLGCKSITRAFKL